jgi:hypothetical protein
MKFHWIEAVRIGLERDLQLRAAVGVPELGAVSQCMAWGIVAISQPRTW